MYHHHLTLKLCLFRLNPACAPRFLLVFDFNPRSPTISAGTILCFLDFQLIIAFCVISTLVAPPCVPAGVQGTISKLRPVQSRVRQRSHPAFQLLRHVYLDDLVLGRRPVEHPLVRRPGTVRLRKCRPSSPAPPQSHTFRFCVCFMLVQFLVLWSPRCARALPLPRETRGGV